MKRLLRLACHVTVVGWLATYLAWTVAGAPAPADEAADAPQIAQLEPIREEPEPPAAPEPPELKEHPERAPEPEPEEPVAAHRVGEAEVARGRALLDGDGAFPALTFRYDQFPSFGEYARAMTGLGARFVVVRQKHVVASIDPESALIGSAAVDDRFSPRARDYSDEPGIAPLARAAEGRFGPDAEVMMLVPRAFDAGLFGAIEHALTARRDRHDDYSEIRGRYERGPDGGLRVRVETGVRYDGRLVPLDMVFDLSGVALG